MKKHEAGTDYNKVRSDRSDQGGEYLKKAGYADGGEIKTDGEPDMEPRPHGKKRGGGVHSEQAEEKMVVKHKDTKGVEGVKGPKRMDKFARGGAAKHKGGKSGTKVNVIVAGGGAGAGAQGPDPKTAFKAGMMTGAKAAAAKMSGGAPSGPPAGGAPMAPQGAPDAGGPPPPMQKRGGKVKETVIEAGSRSGVGRLEKAHAEKRLLKHTAFQTK